MTSDILGHSREYILCAAIYVDTGVPGPPRSYTYPATGLVFSGWRHADCFTTMMAWAERLTPEEREEIGVEQLAGRHQGFLTSTGRFVLRDEAWKIAHSAGQISWRPPEDPLFCRSTETKPPWLTSEDLY